MDECLNRETLEKCTECFTATSGLWGYFESKLATPLHTELIEVNCSWRRKSSRRAGGDSIGVRVLHMPQPAGNATAAAAAVATCNLLELQLPALDWTRLDHTQIAVCAHTRMVFLRFFCLFLLLCCANGRCGYCKCFFWLHLLQILRKAPGKQNSTK